jgi:hypothetical protein
MSNSCSTSDEVRFDVSFYFENKEHPGVDSTYLIKYSQNSPFPDFKKGDKFYTSQAEMYPRVEREIRDNLRNNKVDDIIWRFPEELIDTFINDKKEFEKEHHVHKVKIISVYKSLKNDWGENGKTRLVYTIEYKVKECFHWSSYYWKRIFKEKIQKIKNYFTNNILIKLNPEY